eukprot:scaffold443_cov527-Prasinococcus_capsulatus_cf.AAC.25
MGKVIDSHDAVWKFNTHYSKAMTEEDYDNLWQVTGKKCTYRIFNRKRSLAPLENGFRPLQVNPQNETWLFWHTGTAANMQDLLDVNPSYLFSPELVNWQVEVYFQLRAELIRMGSRHFSCPNNISSGVHGILLALQVCACPSP